MKILKSLTHRIRRMFGAESRPETLQGLQEQLALQQAPATPRQVQAVAAAMRSNPESIPLAVRSNRAHRYGFKRYSWGGVFQPMLFLIAFCSAVTGILRATYALWPSNPAGLLIVSIVALVCLIIGKVTKGGL